MTSRFPLPLLALLAASVGCALAAGDVRAVNVQRSFVQNATGACQSALPVFDGQIRKRPLAVQNEGNASAFVSCSFTVTDRTAGGFDDILLYSDNNTGSAIDMTCTMITGTTGTTITAYPKTLSLPANSKTNLFRWRPVDNGGQNFDSYTINVSCNLPVGTGLTVSFLYFNENIGL